MPPFNKVPQDEIDNFVEDANNGNTLEIGDSTEARTYSHRFCKYSYINAKKALYVVACVALATLAVVFAFPALRSGEEEEWTPTLMTSEEIDLSELDTTRKASSFDPIMTTGTYHQYSDIWAESDMNLAGLEFASISATQVSNVMTVSNLEDGGKEISSVVTEVDLDVKANGEEFQYHSETDGDNPDFDLLNQLVGTENVIRIDKYGKITYSSVNQKLLESMQEKSSSLTTSEHYSQLSDMSKALPSTNSVKPNDKWEFDMDLSEDAVPFSGTSTLLGYTNYDGADVAVLKMAATVSDIISMEDMVENVADDQLKDELYHTKIKNGRMTGYMFWDTKDNFSRWVEMNISLVMEMPNPMGGSAIDVPVTEKIVTYAHR